MTDCPFISSFAHRLLRPNRPSQLVHSDRKSRAIGASRVRFGSDTGQISRRNLEAAACILQTNAFVTVTGPADSALSP